MFPKVEKTPFGNMVSTQSAKWIDPQLTTVGAHSDMYDCLVNVLPVVFMLTG